MGLLCCVLMQDWRYPILNAILKTVSKKKYSQIYIDKTELL